MNTQQTLRHLVPASVTALLLTALVGCADRNVPTEPATPSEPTLKSTAADAWDKTKEVTKDTYESVKDAATTTAYKLERATYDERMAIKANLAEASAKLDTKITEWQSDGKTVSTENQVRLASAKSEFNQSLDELGNATASGWEAAKAKTAAAWEKLKAAYDDATTN